MKGSPCNRAWLGLLALAVALGTTAASSPAHALCDADTGVRVSFEGSWPSGQPGAIVAELRASLAVQGFELCLAAPLDEIAADQIAVDASAVTAPPRVSTPTADSPRTEAPSPLARIRIQHLGTARTGIEVYERVTDKRVSRDVDLSAFPEDAMALAIAIAADELLRASWAELWTEPEPNSLSSRPSAPPPAAVTAWVERERTRVVDADVLQRSRWLGLAAEVRWHGQGALLGGGGLRFEAAVGPRWGIALVFDGARMRTAPAANGTVDAVALGGGLDLIVTLVGTRRGLELVAIGGARAHWIRFSGIAEGAASGKDAGSYRIGLRLGPEGRIQLGPVQLRMGLWLGGAPRAVSATGDGRVVVGTGGIEAGGIAGVGVRL